mmetsp:Transcript_7852/g.14445  ORF Transcript_7852/g.14445 Transcript_7852/m.14445 type:complete len:342 (-) Transcript_7852:245-1270(-)
MAYGEVDVTEAEEAGLFAAPAFFITFRETLEAAIIVSVLLGLLEKLDMRNFKKYVWFGVVSATVVCIVLAVVLVLLISVLKTFILEKDSQNYLTGVLSLFAAILIGFVANSLGNVMAIHQKYANKMTQAVRENALSKSSIIFLSFTTVLREGVETIIFFIGIGAAFPPESLPLPSVLGAVIGVIIGVALYRCGGKVTLRVFFQVTVIMLVFIGAGVFTNGVHEIMSATNLPEEGIRKRLFDISDCCGLDNNFWVFMRVLFGYSPSPTALEIMMYVLYHVVVWTFLMWRYTVKSKKKLEQASQLNKMPSADEIEKVESVRTAGESSVGSDEVKLEEAQLSKV